MVTNNKLGLTTSLNTNATLKKDKVSDLIFTLFVILLSFVIMDLQNKKEGISFFPSWGFKKVFQLNSKLLKTRILNPRPFGRLMEAGLSLIVNANRRSFRFLLALRDPP